MNSYLLVLTALAAVAVGMPRYALVPVEDLQYLPQLRMARSLPVEEPGVIQYAAPSDSRPVRQAGPGGYGEQVDYGGYTGGYGAFGWYTDHPVYSYGH